jgi:hypothetical protein
MQPIGSLRETVCKKPDVKSVAVDLILSSRQQVEEQRPKPRAMENAGHVSVSGAESAAATAMGEDDDGTSLLSWRDKSPRERYRSEVDRHFNLRRLRTASPAQLL